MTWHDKMLSYFNLQLLDKDLPPEQKIKLTEMIEKIKVSQAEHKIRWEAIVRRTKVQAGVLDYEMEGR